MPESLTRDELKRFGLLLDQPEKGYRFNLDPLLLCDFCAASTENSIADIGSGSGVIALVLARMAADAKVVAIEKEPAMAQLAASNAVLNNLAERVQVICNDLLHLQKELPVSDFDLVVSNPPYYRIGHGRPSHHPSKLSARHETSARLYDFISLAKYLVKPSGRICFVYHPARLPEFMTIAIQLKLAVRRLRFVHGTPTSEAKVFLAELGKGNSNGMVSTKLLPPFVVRTDKLEYTEEAAQMLGL